MSKTKHIRYTFGLIACILMILLLFGCTQTQTTPGTEKSGKTDGDSVQTTTTLSPPEEGETLATQELIRFDDISEVKKFLAEKSQANQAQGIGRTTMSFAMEDSVAESAPMMKSAPVPGMVGGMEGDYATDYSETNIQVKGVDEGDFVKNDDRYIYMIADNKLTIIDAYDAKNADIISTTKISDTNDDNYDYYNSPMAKELFISGDRLALFVQTNEKTFYFAKYDIEPRETYRQMTDVYIYDISDRKNPEEVDHYTIAGSYYQSRMIDNIIYVVTQEYTGSINYINEPMVKSSSSVISPEIYYFDNPDNNYYFNTVTSIDLMNNDVIDSKSFMLGYSNTLMVSQDNIYIAYQKQNYWWCWYCGERYDKTRFYDIIVPRLQGQLKTDIKSILDKNLDDADEWQEISQVLGEFFEKATDDDSIKGEYEDMLLDIMDALEEYDTKKQLEERKTVIQKIEINNGKLNYKAKGEVYGTLLNQFSLDEYDGNLRLATTVNIWNRKSIQYNNVYVLDKDMRLIGQAERIAEDERIYSTRFVGDRLYMVTFRQIDPFFVIDISDPNNPKILGQLKIPGYSDYLHPYDEDHIIGVGKAADTDGRVGGVKIALFDVSDVKNPKEIDNFEIGDRGSDSAALHNHHAFLFSKTKNLLVIPVTEITDRQELGRYRFSNSIWNGAYVFHVDDKGFDLKGKVKHSSTKSDYFDWWSQATVLRSLYMDDNLYTISNKYIKINDLSSDDVEELNTVNLPYSDARSYYWWR